MFSLFSQKNKNELNNKREQLYRVAYSWCNDASLADDLTNETLFKAIKKWPGLRDKSSVNSWLFKILANCWYDYLRKIKPSESIDELVFVDHETPELLLQQQEIIIQVRKAVSLLAMGQRQVITLVDLEGFSYEEVNSYLRYGLAASLFLLLGGFAGWNGAFFYAAPFAEQSLLHQIQLDSSAKNQHQVLLHIATDDALRVESALSNAERLLTRSTDEKFQLQILVNAEGIKILQAENSPYIERIRSLAQAHENVSFLACQRSIERQKLLGIDIHLVKEARIIPEALKAIVNHLNRGWVYIRA